MYRLRVTDLKFKIESKLTRPYIGTDNLKQIDPLSLNQPTGIQGPRGNQFKFKTIKYKHDPFECTKFKSSLQAY
jgi:hypothetical protein